jgi:hypothetical protein
LQKFDINNNRTRNSLLYIWVNYSTKMYESKIQNK